MHKHRSRQHGRSFDKCSSQQDQEVGMSLLLDMTMLSFPMLWIASSFDWQHMPHSVKQVSEELQMLVRADALL